MEPVNPTRFPGMPAVLPNFPPYIPRFGKTVFMNVGSPLAIEPVLRSLEGSSPLEKRKVITDFIQSEMEALRKETLALVPPEVQTKDSL